MSEELPHKNFTWRDENRDGPIESWAASFRDELIDWIYRKFYSYGWDWACDRVHDMFETFGETDYEHITVNPTFACLKLCAKHTAIDEVRRFKREKSGGKSEHVSLELLPDSVSGAFLYPDQSLMAKELLESGARLIDYGGKKRGKQFAIVGKHMKEAFPEELKPSQIVQQLTEDEVVFFLPTGGAHLVDAQKTLTNKVGAIRQEILRQNRNFRAKDSGEWGDLSA